MLKLIMSLFLPVDKISPTMQNHVWYTNYTRALQKLSNDHSVKSPSETKKNSSVK